MTDDEARDLGERLVPGMLVHSGAWPDLRDAATRGCVLQLLCDRDLAVLSEHACREEALALALEGT